MSTAPQQSPDGPDVPGRAVGRQSSPPDVSPSLPSGGESMTPIWDELLASMPAEQVARLRVAVRAEVRAALDNLTPAQAAQRVRRSIFRRNAVERDATGERFEADDRPDDGRDVRVHVGHDDSPSVGPGVAAPGGEPTVGAAGDTSGGVDSPPSDVSPRGGDGS